MHIEIRNTTIDQLDQSCEIMDSGIAFQKRKGHPHYHSNDRAFHERDILRGQHYTVYVNDQVAGIFSLSFNDEVIWRSKEQGDAVYLHRVISKDQFKGLRLFQHILNWTIDFTNQKGRKYIRLDTWDNNPPLVDYYKSFGFEINEHFVMPHTNKLSVNAWGSEVVLMQYEVRYDCYMIIETFQKDKTKELYQRFEEQGRMLPIGLRYKDSWIDHNLEVCYQLMESPSLELIQDWTALWEDLANFQIIPVHSSAEAKTKILKQHSHGI